MKTVIILKLTILSQIYLLNGYITTSKYPKLCIHLYGNGKFDFPSSFREDQSKNINQRLKFFTLLTGSILALLQNDKNNVNAMEVSDTSISSQESLSSSEFREKYPYRTSQDFVNYILSNTREGDTDGVLLAMDKFAKVYPMYKLTPAKGNCVMSYKYDNI